MASKGTVHPQNLGMVNAEKLAEANPVLVRVLRQIIKGLAELGRQPRVVSVRRTKQ
jgi:hypothetical protein